MPDWPTYPTSGSPLSLAELAKTQIRGPLYYYLRHLALADVRHVIDDFEGDTINLDNYAVANGGGASVASFAISVQENGAIRGTTGTAGNDTASASIIGPKTWKGDRQCGIEIRWTPITAVTECRFECGFVDVVPGSSKSVVNSLTTPTVNTSVVDAAVNVFNDASSVITNELVTIGTSIDAAKHTFTAGTTRAAATSVRTRIQLGGPAGVGNFVKMWDDGILVASGTSGTAYIEGGSAVCAWARVSASDGTSKSMDIDYIEIWALRL